MRGGESIEVLFYFVSPQCWLSLNLGQIRSDSKTPCYLNRETYRKRKKNLSNLLRMEAADKRQLIGSDGDSADWCSSRNLNLIPLCNVVIVLPDLEPTRLMGGFVDPLLTLSTSDLSVLKMLKSFSREFSIFVLCFRCCSTPTTI